MSGQMISIVAFPIVRSKGLIPAMFPFSNATVGNNLLFLPCFNFNLVSFARFLFFFVFALFFSLFLFFSSVYACVCVRERKRERAFDSDVKCNALSFYASRPSCCFHAG